MLFLLFFSARAEIPRGALPSTWERYKMAINEQQQTFECFDKSAVISLSQVNDNYLDCADGSDEPGTAANPLGKFYCQNKGAIPKEIDSWEVGDGLCDCCDGSDEFGNPDVECPNVCAADQEGRRDLIAEIEGVIRQGIVMNENLSDPEKSGYNEACLKSRDLHRRMDELERERTRIQEEGEAERSKNKPDATTSVDSENSARESFRAFVKKAWMFTFMIPKSYGDDFDREEMNMNSRYDYDYEPPWGREAQKKIDKIDEQLDKLREEAGSSRQLCQKCENRTEFFALAKTAFKLGKFTLEILNEVRNDWNDIGKLKSIDRKMAVYKDGMHCWERDKNSKTVVHLKCSNESKLVDMWEVSQCKFNGVFLTPLACSQDDIAALGNMTLAELQNYRRQILQTPDPSEEIQFYDAYDDPYRDRYYRDYYNHAGEYYDRYDYPLD